MEAWCLPIGRHRLVKRQAEQMIRLIDVGIMVTIVPASPSDLSKASPTSLMLLQGRTMVPCRL